MYSLPPPHIHKEHGASDDQASISIQGDDMLTEQNVANNTVVKKPHAGNSGTAAGARPGVAAASMTNVEQGKSPAKSSSSPLKEKWTSFTQGLSNKAEQVTKRLYNKSPNKKCSKSEEGDESHSEASTEKKKTPKKKNKKNKKADEEEDEMPKENQGGRKKDKSSDDDPEVISKCEHCDKHPKEIHMKMYKCIAAIHCIVFSLWIDFKK